MAIPFVDLRVQHNEVRDEIEQAFRDIVDHSSFVGGHYVTDFEQDFAAYCGATQAVAVATGTDALRLALMAAGVRSGEEVITVPNTFIATVEAITQVGAWPVFVDIDAATATMDPQAVEDFLTNGCRRGEAGRPISLRTGRPVTAVLPVHLYGQPADMTPLLRLAAEYGLRVIEDACQAHGARYRLDGQWKRTGALGLAAAFSFYPGKNLGAMGEGGAVVTNDAPLAAQIRLLRDHGQSERYVHVTPQGWNARLDTIQCAVLGIKLKRLDEWNSRRRTLADLYQKMLAELPLKLPVEREGAEHVYHLYVVETPERERLRQALNVRGIGTGLHYPIPLHLQKAYAHLGWGPGSFPRSEASASSLLSLPMHPALVPAQVEQVAQACREILAA